MHICKACRVTRQHIPSQSCPFLSFNFCWMRRSTSPTETYRSIIKVTLYKFLKPWEFLFNTLHLQKPHLHCMVWLGSARLTFDTRYFSSISFFTANSTPSTWAGHLADCHSDAAWNCHDIIFNTIQTKKRCWKSKGLEFLIPSMWLFGTARRQTLFRKWLKAARQKTNEKNSFQQSVFFPCSHHFIYGHLQLPLTLCQVQLLLLHICRLHVLHSLCPVSGLQCFNVTF